MLTLIINLHHIYAGTIVPVSAIIPVTIGFYTGYHKQQNTVVILYYLLFAMLMGITERVVGVVYHNNLPLLHFYTLVEGVFIFVFYQKTFNARKARLIINLLMLLFILLCIMDVTVFHSIYTFNSYARPVASILVIMLGTLYLFMDKDLPVNTGWLHAPANWINTGLLIYFGSSLVYFTLSNLMLQFASDRMWFFIQNIHATFVLLMYLLFTAGFLSAKPK